MRQNRRQMLLASGAAMLGSALLGRSHAEQKRTARRILFFTKSSGFQHSVITRKGGQPAHAERILTALGREHGYEVVASKDGRLFEPRARQIADRLGAILVAA